MNKEKTSPAPEQRIGVGFFGAIVDKKSPWGCVINEVLEKAGMAERFQIIIVKGDLDEDLKVAEGIWTSKEVKMVADRITFANCDENLHVQKTDYETTGESNDYSETFNVKPRIVKLLIDSGFFRRKPNMLAEEVYTIDLPEEIDKSNTSIEMRHHPSPECMGRENITLRFFL
jgi:hypothetical protein